MADRAASFGGAIILGAALVVHVVHIATRWTDLRRRDQIVALGLASILWLAAMLLIDSRLAGLRADVAAWLWNHPASPLPGLSLVIVAGALLTTAHVERLSREP
jgi:hypothetical protein